MKDDDPEELLPDDVKSLAIKSGREWGWREKDIAGAIEAAARIGLSTIGGQVQFVLPNGTCELYWRNYDATGRQQGEPWSEYVKRSAAEVTAALKTTLAMDLIEEGKTNLNFLRGSSEKGVDLARHLCFIVYFGREK